MVVSHHFRYSFLGAPGIQGQLVAACGMLCLRRGHVEMPRMVPVFWIFWDPKKTTEDKPVTIPLAVNVRFVQLLSDPSHQTTQQINCSQHGRSAKAAWWWLLGALLGTSPEVPAPLTRRCGHGRERRLQDKAADSNVLARNNRVDKGRGCGMKTVPW